MGFARRIVRRSLLGHPGRTLFSILGVALGIATVVGVFTLDHVTVLSRMERLDPDYGADMEVRPSKALQDPRRELLEMEGVAGVAAFFQNDVGLRPLIRESGDDRPERIRLVGLEAGSARTLGVYHVDRGEDLSQATAAHGVLVGAALADKLELELGDALVLSQPRRAAKKLCIEGEYQTASDEQVPVREGVFTLVGVLSREGLGRRANGRMVVVDYNAGKELLRDVFLESEFWLKRDHSVDIEVLESDLARDFTYKRNEAQAVGQMADERAFRNGVRLAGLFALLLGLFVIFHTLSMSLIERVREVGSLHSLGATRAQIARVFFLEALFIAGSAGVLGLAAGLGLAALLLANGISTLGVTGRAVTPFNVPWDIVLPLTLIGVAMALIGSVYPILRIKSSNLVAALSGEERGQPGMARGFQLFSTLLLIAIVPIGFFQVVPVIGAAESELVTTMVIGLLALGLFIGWPLIAPGWFGTFSARLAQPFQRPFPLVGKLVRRRFEGNPGRIGASMAAIALVTAAFVGLKGMTNSLAGETEDWGRVATGDKVWIEHLPDVAFDEVLECLQELPEVLGVESGDGRTFPSFLLLGMRLEELAKYGPLAEDPGLLRRLRTEQTMLISDRLARQRGLVVGDRVLTQTSGHGVQEFRVAGISDAYGYFPHPDERAYGIVGERYLRRFFCVPTHRTSSIAVKMTAADKTLVAAALRERFPRSTGLFVYDGSALLSSMLEDIRVDFVLFDIILFLTALLAGLGVLNGQLLAALERKKELGILRALGTTRGQVAGIVLLESGLIGLLGGVLGLVVGSGLTPVLVSTLRVLSGLNLPLRSAGVFLGFSLGAALVVSLVAGLYPIWRMNRFDPVRSVRTG